MTDSEARQIHEMALEAQEKGDFVKALQLEVQAMILYQKTGDKLGFAEIQAMFYLTYKHLYDQTGDENYLVLAKHSAMISVELAQKSGDKTALAIPLFNLAKSQEAVENYAGALESYKENLEYIEKYPDQNHDTEAVKLDFKIHTLTSEMKNGNFEVENEVLDALKKLETSQSNSDYERSVWLTSGYMRLAAILQEKDPKKAKEYLDMAKAVIDKDSRLTLMLKKWEKLAKSFATIGIVLLSSFFLSK